MTFQLNELTINNDKTLNQLKDYLRRVSNFDTFDYTQPVRIYVDNNKDFTFFEAINYNLSFNSNAHKLVDSITSPYAPLETDFNTFRLYVNSIPSYGGMYV